MRKTLRNALTLLAVFSVGLVVGCRSGAMLGSDARDGEGLKDAMSNARASGRPVAVLVVDPARGDDDRSALAAFKAASSEIRDDADAVVLDLTISRNRAAAAPLHGVDAPTFVCLTPAAIVVSRDEGQITQELIRDRVADAKSLHSELDRTFADLNAAVTAAPDDVNRRMTLADFLLARHNDREAIPHLKQVSANEQAELAVRVRAWTALGRAHLWIIEPEKARYSAQALIATLGPKSPDAVAGGNLVRGMQDTRAKRYGRARDELNAAIAAAPDSPYGREAAELLAKLPPATGK